MPGPTLCFFFVVRMAIIFLGYDVKESIVRGKILFDINDQNSIQNCEDGLSVRGTDGAYESEGVRAH